MLGKCSTRGESADYEACKLALKPWPLITRNPTAPKEELTLSNLNKTKQMFQKEVKHIVQFPSDSGQQMWMTF